MPTPQSTMFYPGQPDYIEKLNLLMDSVRSIYSLTDGATITLDLSVTHARTFKVTLGGNRSLVVTGGSADLDGKQFVVRVKQDGTGNRTLALSTGINVGTDLASAPLSTSANLTDYLAFVYRHETAKADFVSIIKGFPNS